VVVAVVERGGQVVLERGECAFDFGEVRVDLLA
jgi:hypothetical protein